MTPVTHRPGTNVVFGLLSRAAVGARVWLAVAAALAAVGGRFGRRAAGRGLLALGVVEVASVAAKPFIRRRRPRRRLVALLARRTSPTTSSLPSTHAAAAFAFATGAAMELPVVAPVLGTAAAAVSWSRVRTGQHHPTDVAAGAALGLATALATRRIWPVAPHQAARAAAIFDAAGAGVGDSIAVVVNAAAGSVLGPDPVRKISDALPTATVIAIAEPDQLAAALERAAEADVVGVSGGDGTVNAAARVAHAAGKPLLVLPGGTLNHFAHALGIATLDDGVEASTGKVVAVDVGTIAGRLFVNTASFGVYTDLVDARERLERRIGKWPALIVALGSVLGRAQPLELDIDGRHRRVWMAFIGNCRYHPHGFAPSWRERLDDGQLDIRLVDAASPFSRTRLVLAVLTGLLGRSRVYEERTVERLQVRSLDGPLRLAADGEVFDGPAEFVIAKADNPLHVLVPAT